CRGRLGSGLAPPCFDTQICKGEVLFERNALAIDFSTHLALNRTGQGQRACQYFDPLAEFGILLENLYVAVKNFVVLVFGSDSLQSTDNFEVGGVFEIYFRRDGSAVRIEVVRVQIPRRVDRSGED